MRAVEGGEDRDLPSPATSVRRRGPGRLVVDWTLDTRSSNSRGKKHEGLLPVSTAGGIWDATRSYDARGDQMGGRNHQQQELAADRRYGGNQAPWTVKRCPLASFYQKDTT